MSIGRFARRKQHIARIARGRQPPFFAWLKKDKDAHLVGAFFQTAFGQLRDFFKARTLRQLITMCVVAVLVIAACVFAGAYLSRVSYTVLYADMKDQDAAEVYAHLKELGVPAKSVKTDSGTTISVPEEQAEDLRLQMVTDGFPKSGDTYPIYQLATGLGVTSQQQQVYYLYQLEQKLAATLRRMSVVSDAEVRLNIPEDSVFVMKGTQQKASASVFLVLKEPRELSKTEVNTIARLVSGAAKTLSPQDVVITDSLMSNYTFDDPDAPDSQDPATYLDQLALTERVQRSYEKQLTSFLTPILGAGNFVPTVSVTLDFDKTSQQSVVYEPPVKAAGSEGIKVSYRELTEAIRGEDLAQGQVGLDANGGAPVYPSTATDTNRVYDKAEREYNMEVNELRTMIDKARGTVLRKTVSVSVDADSLSEEFEEKLKALVANALDITDMTAITVYRMPFARSDESATAWREQAASDMAKAAAAATTRMIIIVAGIILLIIILTIIVVRMLRPKPAMVPETPGDIVDVPEANDQETALVAPDELLVKKNHDLERIEQLIDQDPEVAAQLLRSWLVEDFR